MRILHVSLGNPKTHQGGLNRYCSEIMEMQKKLGNEVFILYPGTFKQNGNVSIKKIGRDEYRIENALPVAITYGIDDPERYMVQVDHKKYMNWLKLMQLDVIHVHSIQGIHKEFFNAVKLIGIRLVFTTHDYYPLCFKCVFYDKKGKLCDGFDEEKCSLCNYNSGLSYRKQQILQNDFYQSIKNNFVFKLMREKLVWKENIIENTEDKDEKVSVEKVLEYKKLHQYYIDILQMMDIIHCNSNKTYIWYSEVVGDRKCKIVEITHKGLKRRVHKRKDKSSFNIGYMGGMSPHKGYRIFEEALELLSKNSDKKWNAFFYGGKFSNENTNNKFYNGYFSTKDSARIWENIDILVAPSQWPETFGFIILEALCQGIPVVTSELYGSSYLVEKLEKRLVFFHESANELMEALIWIMNESIYNSLCERIDKMQLDIDMKCHTKKILELYQ